MGSQEQIVKVLIAPLMWSTSAGVNSRAFWRLRTLLFPFIVFPFFHGWFFSAFKAVIVHFPLARLDRCEINFHNRPVPF
jgi:hypothetical protein